MKEKWENIKLLVLDFDGVLTDGFVYVDQDGRETVRCSRKDGLGIGLIAKLGVGTIVISKEKNGVVAARCKKLNIECFYGIDDKLPLLEELLEKSGINPQNVCYVGDDITDADCIQHVGIGVAVADAVQFTKDAADYVTNAEGGKHVVREVCDLIREAKLICEANLVTVSKSYGS